MITIEQYEEASENCIGWCKECGDEYSGIEPDAEHVECDQCETPTVAGCDIWLLEGLVE